MRRLYCTCAVLICLAAPAAAQQAPAPARQPTGYRVFVRGIPVGREDVTVEQNAGGMTITSQGRLDAPLNVAIKRAEMKYRADGSPELFTFEGNTSNNEISVRTTFENNVAATTGTQAGQAVNISHPLTPRAIVLPNGVFGAYAALTSRLVGSSPGADLRAYLLPQAEIGIRVAALNRERLQLGTTFLYVRRYDLLVQNAGGELPVTLTAAEDGSLVRITIPSQGLDVVRDDVASPTSRTQVYSNPGDEAVVIQALGFNIGATITKPAKAGAARVPAVIVLGGSGAADRDGFLFGVPIVGQLAGSFAEAGFLSVRYDRRGFGQSGGRAESATLGDYAEDVRAVVRWLLERKDVDPKRIAVVGHDEGAWIALLAATREKRIAAVASIDGAASTGADLNLEQQRYELDQLALPPAERDRKIALQKQIQTAVVTGKGWEGVPANERKQADTPWLQSFLSYDPAKVMSDLKQPLLIVHAGLDKQVPVAHADRLAEVARKQSGSKSVEVIVVRGVNHLLVPAVTGDLSEYATLTDRNVSKDVSGSIGAWLTKTFGAIK
jgi:uncharacterized protein